MKNKNKLEDSGRRREITGKLKIIVTVISAVFTLFYIYTAKAGVTSPQLNRGFYVGVTFVLIFLVFPINKKNRKLSWYDYILIFLTVLSILYFILEFKEMAFRAGAATKYDIIFGIMLVGLSIEVTRRVTGKALAYIALTFLIYNFAGPYLPGLLAHSGFSVQRVFSFMFTSLYGIFGSVAQIFSSFVFLFIIFGSFLEQSGAAKFFIDLPYALTGRTRGGPAKAAVLASGLMGSVSGSAVANVVTTGTFTIPLMKKTGYKPHTAAAIETAASSGGQLLPPIMGAGAFIMAEFTGLPYWEIVAVSFFPALLYFLSVLVMVDLRAAKMGLKGLSKSELPSVKKTFKEGWQFLLPIFAIVFLLVNGNSPSLAAFWAIIITIIVSWFRKDTRMGIYDIIEALKKAALKSLTVGATVGSIGIIIGTVYLTGLGLKFSNIILSLSGGFIPIAIILVAVASYVLGMGLTVTSSYIILAVLAAPALKELGIGLLAAHLIVFWLSQDANVTPPVCLAAFAGAGIADADPMKTGWSALRFAKGLYIVPFLIAYTPILFNGPIRQVILTLITSMIGIILSSIALEGYFKRKLHLFERIFAGLLAFLFFIPDWKFNLLSLILSLIYYYFLENIFARLINKESISKVLVEEEKS